jgi:hypothetical protein
MDRILWKTLFRPPDFVRVPGEGTYVVLGKEIRNTEENRENRGEGIFAMKVVCQHGIRLGQRIIQILTDST